MTSPVGSDSRSVVVVGGGIIGLWCALELLRANENVTLLDANKIGARSSSTGNAGIIAASHFRPITNRSMVFQGLFGLLKKESPFTIGLRPTANAIRWTSRALIACRASQVERAEHLYAQMGQETRQLYLRAAAEYGFDLQPSGLLEVTRSADAMEAHEREAQHATSLGIDAKALDHQGIKSLEPSLGDRFHSGIYFPNDAQICADQLVSCIRAQGLARGLNLIEDCPVQRITKHAGSIEISCKNRSFRAARVVLATGAWSYPLLRGLGLLAPMIGGRGYSATFDDVTSPLQRSVILTDERIALSTQGRSFRASGHMRLVENDDTIDPRRVERMEHRCRELVELTDKKPRVWAGLRPCTPDSLPYIGPVRRLPGLYLAAGHGMLGITHAPLTARWITEAITSTGAGAGAPALLAPDRYDPS